MQIQARVFSDIIQCPRKMDDHWGFELLAVTDKNSRRTYMDIETLVG